MRWLYYIIFLFFFLSCSNILYKHDDAMSMLNTKNLVLDRFGKPSNITKGEKYDEYYYDFGVFEERSQNFDPKISTVSEFEGPYSPANWELETQYRLTRTNKYLKFRIIGEKVIYWESRGVNFPVKKNDK